MNLRLGTFSSTAEDTITTIVPTTAAAVESVSVDSSMPTATTTSRNSATYADATPRRMSPSAAPTSTGKLKERVPIGTRLKTIGSCQPKHNVPTTRPVSDTTSVASTVST